MPSDAPQLTLDAVTASIARRSITAPRGAPCFGLELEWLTSSTAEPERRIRPDEILAALDGVTLPHGGAITIEPGGQVELSSRAHPSLCAVLDATLTDAAALRGALTAAGIATTAEPVDRHRAPERVLDVARYAAMEAFFDRDGPHGRTMMCNTASMQVNVDVVGNAATAWHAAEAVARVLPDKDDRRSIWAGIDASRTAPVGGDDPAVEWPRYALDARVMFVRVDSDTCIPLFDGLTLRGWIEHGHELGWPTASDVDEHLTTLFPPVRPRGFLELRTLDTCDESAWPALAATAIGAIADPRCAAQIAALDRDEALDRTSLTLVAAEGVARLGAPEALIADVIALGAGVPCR